MKNIPYSRHDEFIAHTKLSADQIKKLHDDHITLVEAPSPNQVILPTRIIWVFKKGNDNYTEEGSLFVKFAGQTVNHTQNNVLSKDRAGQPVQGDTLYNEILGYQDNVADMKGLALVLYHSEANPSDGDGRLEITVYYNIFQV